MRTINFLMSLALVTGCAFSMAAASKVVSYPAPPQRYLSADYTIRTNGIEVPVYRALTQHHDKK